MVFELWKPVVKRQPWLLYTGKLPPRLYLPCLKTIWLAPEPITPAWGEVCVCRCCR